MTQNKKGGISKMYNMKNLNRGDVVSTYINNNTYEVMSVEDMICIDKNVHQFLTLKERGTGVLLYAFADDVLVPFQMPDNSKLVKFEIAFVSVNDADSGYVVVQSERELQNYLLNTVTECVLNDSKENKVEFWVKRVNEK